MQAQQVDPVGRLSTDLQALVLLCRTHASEALTQAQGAGGPSERAVWQEAAEAWHAAADYYDPAALARAQVLHARALARLD